MHDHHHSLSYGRGFLIGRVHAYQRGSLSLTHVAGAVALAKRFGVTDEDIAGILHASALQWDDTQQSVTAQASRYERPTLTGL